MNQLKNIGLGLLLLAGIQAGKATAETLNFSFSGYQDSILFTAFGIGTFSFPDGLTHLSLSDLTSFSYTDLEVFVNLNPVGPNPPATFSNLYQFGAANLQTFSLTLDGTMPIDFTMATTPQSDTIDGSLRVLGINPTLPPGQFFARDGGATGLVTFSNQAPAFPTPEPSSVALTVLASLCGFFAYRKWRTQSQ
jgi:hypothetical protein